MNRKTTGIIQMSLCAFLWSIAGVVIKNINSSPFLIAGVRSLFAAFCMLFFMMFSGIKFTINKKVISGGVFSALTFILFVLANKMTYAANAIVLQFTEPVFLLIFTALIFKEKLKGKDVTTALVTLLGVALFFADSLSGDKLLGNLVAIGAGCSMALMYMILGKVSEKERMSSMLTGHILTAIFGITAFLISPDKVSGMDFFLMAFLGIVQLGIPYVLFCLAVGKCSAFACSLIGAIEPLLNPLWVMLFTGETPGKFALFGGIIVISAVTLWSIFDVKEGRESVS